jgi:hypothetical protein
MERRKYREIPRDWIGRPWVLLPRRGHPGIILPSFEVLMRLEAEKKILAGGLPVGDRAFVFIAEASSNEELDRLLRSIPMWGALKWKVTALQTFAGGGFPRTRNRKTAQENYPLKTFLGSEDEEGRHRSVQESGMVRRKLAWRNLLPSCRRSGQYCHRFKKNGCFTLREALK